MQKKDLRAIQAPLKAKYKAEPKAALITLSAESQLGDGVSCSVRAGQAFMEAGLHPATDGTGFQACSGDMLLQALAACAGVTLSAVATALEIPIESGRLNAEGDLDVRGTLGVSKETPVGFKEIRLRVTLRTTASPAEIDKLMELTQRYCVVLQTLRAPLSVKTVGIRE